MCTCTFPAPGWAGLECANCRRRLPSPEVMVQRALGAAWSVLDPDELVELAAMIAGPDVIAEAERILSEEAS